MLFQEGIIKKRDGQALGRDEIEAMVQMVSDGRAANEQLGAWTMAILLRGMDARERGDLTRAMAASGRVLRWPGLEGRVVDKHSSGGVGDKVSLMLAPIAAACGVYVPMISGRGLGHTGGTLDKLDSVPGYNTRADIDTFARVVREVGCAIIGQTDDLAPADRRLYAIRDVSGTVESPALITASILSKKLAAGLDRLVMDVKVGNGAFCRTLEEARVLAQSLSETGAACGLPLRVSVTSMQQVLGASAGNALEVREAVDFLTQPARDARLEHVTLHLAAEMLLDAHDQQPSHYDEAFSRARQALQSGQAAEVFARMVRALGGPVDLLTRSATLLPVAPAVLDVPSPRAGVVQAVDAYRLGLAVIRLGGGRSRASDPIDPRVGLDAVLGIGVPVQAGQPLARIHAASREQAQALLPEVLSSFTLAEPHSAVAVDPVLISGACASC